MNILNVNYSGTHRTEKTAITNHTDRLEMFENYVKPLLESFSNITFLKRVDNSDLQTAYHFNISGFDNIILSFWFGSPSNTSGTTSYIFGLSKIENADIWQTSSGMRTLGFAIDERNKSEIITDSEGNKSSYSWLEISFTMRYITDLNNDLQVLYSAQRTSEYPVSAYVFDKDNENRNVIASVFSTNQVDSYYDESYTACTLPENVSISFASDTQCLMDDIILCLNNEFKGVLDNLVKIYNNKWNANSNTNSTGNLLEIDGERYRRINNRLFVRDY